MASIPVLIKDDFERPKLLNQIDFSRNLPINRALTAVAQEVARMLQQAYLVQTDSSNHAQTVAIRAIEPLTARELEVLQLIVDGYEIPPSLGSFISLRAQ